MEIIGDSSVSCNDEYPYNFPIQKLTKDKGPHFRNLSVLCLFL
jgi:hypothetical protein